MGDKEDAQKELRESIEKITEMLAEGYTRLFVKLVAKGVRSPQASTVAARMICSVYTGMVQGGQLEDEDLEDLLNNMFRGPTH